MNSIGDTTRDVNPISRCAGIPDMRFNAYGTLNFAKPLRKTVLERSRGRDHLRFPYGR
jgi:hypothetical protein